MSDFDPVIAFRRFYRLLYFLAPLTGFATGISFSLVFPNMSFAFSVTVLAISWVAVMQFMWRMKCPNCGKTVGRTIHYFQRICPHCDTKIL